MADLPDFLPARGSRAPQRPVQFPDRAAVRAFLHGRVHTLGFTWVSVARHFGYATSKQILCLVNGPGALSLTRPFEGLCALLQLSPEEQLGIMRTEQCGPQQPPAVRVPTGPTAGKDA